MERGATEVVGAEVETEVATEETEVGVAMEETEVAAVAAEEAEAGVAMEETEGGVARVGETQKKKKGQKKKKKKKSRLHTVILENNLAVLFKTENGLIITLGRIALLVIYPREMST